MCLSACAILLFSGCSKSNETIATFKGGTLTVQDFYDNPKVKSNNQTLLKKMLSSKHLMMYTEKRFLQRK